MMEAFVRRFPSILTEWITTRWEESFVVPEGLTPAEDVKMQMKRNKKKRMPIVWYLFTMGIKILMDQILR
jgi:hypothetical protein